MASKYEISQIELKISRSIPVAYAISLKNKYGPNQSLMH